MVHLDEAFANLAIGRAGIEPTNGAGDRSTSGVVKVRALSQGSGMLDNPARDDTD